MSFELTKIFAKRAAVGTLLGIPDGVKYFATGDIVAAEDVYSYGGGAASTAASSGGLVGNIVGAPLLGYALTGNNEMAVAFGLASLINHFAALFTGPPVSDLH